MPTPPPPLESGDAPAGFEIKGNKTSKKFHAPSSPWYDRTNAEVWFRTAEAAEKAGFVNAEAKADEKAGDDGRRLTHGPPPTFESSRKREHGYLRR